MIEFEWQYQRRERWGRGYSLHPCTPHPFGQDAVFISQSSQRSQCNGDFPLSRCSSNCSSRASINCACRCRLVYLRCVIECTGGGERAGGRGISSSSILSSTSTPFRQHVRIYFFHLPAMNTRLIRLLCAPLSFPFSAMIERELSFTI